MLRRESRRVGGSSGVPTSLVDHCCVESIMKHLKMIGRVPSLLLALCFVAGCSRSPAAPAAPPPTPVTVSYPVAREVTESSFFTGRVAAVDSVELRARVWGYLDKVNFKEGAVVQKGDVLFEIDPRTYRAVLTQAEGNLGTVEARLARLDSDLARAKRLVGTAAVSREEYDKVA